MSYSAPFCEDSVITTVDLALIKLSDEDMEDCEVDELMLSALFNNLPLSGYAKETIINDYINGE